MKITRAADYAMRCCLYLSRQGAGELVSRREVSEAMEIPSPFLGKISQHLARDSIIEIIQGARGGYRLLVDPSELTMLRVIEAVMGPITLNDCVVDGRICNLNATCSVHGVWKEILVQFREILGGRTVAGLDGE